MQHPARSRQRGNRGNPDHPLVLLVIIIFVLTLGFQAQAQWDIEDSHTTASLRGIDNVEAGVAWASGTNGTILRTEDGGNVWQLCAIPPGAEKLDFRGIQAFDANTAIVMSSGKGDLSRLYKTTDGCQTWKLIFTNPDREGFWDAVKFPNPKLGFIFGDPVTTLVPKPMTYSLKEAFTGFALFVTEDSGKHFRKWTLGGNKANPKTHGAFAASNSSLFIGWPFLYFGSGGTAGPRVYLNGFQQHIGFPDAHIEIHSGDWHSNSWPAHLAAGESAGIFSIAFLRDQHADKAGMDTSGLLTLRGVAVGGDYLKPENSTATAAFTRNGGQNWTLSSTPPRGFRSAVAYDAQQKLWITVGPNGTDISRDDGRNWTALKPTKEDAPGADKDWNALSLPFVVGPNGRIGKLRPSALNP